MKPLYSFVCRSRLNRRNCVIFCGDHPIKECKSQCVLAELSVEKYSLHSDKTNRMAAFSFCIVVNILTIRIFFNNFLKTISCTLILLQFTMMPSVYSIVDQTRSFPFFPKDAFFLPLNTTCPGQKGHSPTRVELP